MRCLVTGGAGFIGSNLVDRLIQDGNEVVVIDNESSGSYEKFHWNESAENYKYDIADYDKIYPLFKNVDVVFHLAAQARIQVCIENPVTAVKSNILGTSCVLQCAKENGIKRVIYSSTSSAYGLKNDPPLVESMQTDCLNPYSVSKVAGEDLCKMYNDLYGLETIIFRYFNIYGNRQPTKGQYSPVIGLFQNQLELGKPMTVVGDGLQTRDYTNVSDVVEANILASQTQEKEAFGQIFNIGFGKNYSVMELVEMLGGKDANYVNIPNRLGESRHTLSDCSKAERILNWKAKIDLKEWIKICKKQLV